jgi:hypothetical protein
MFLMRRVCRTFGFCAVVFAAVVVTGHGWNENTQTGAKEQAAGTQGVPQSLPMGGNKSRMTFFVTSVGRGKGGDLGGPAGADAHCQALATAEKAGDHTWRAYLSLSATRAQPAVNARDRIGRGPWYNAEAELIAATLDELHGENNRVAKDTALTERGDFVNGVSDPPTRHDLLTGSGPDGTAFSGGDRTCGNWRSSQAGGAQVGHSDRKGQGGGATSWNSAHTTRGCSQQALQTTGGNGLFYCFAID